MSELAIVVLAAGESKRFGKAKQLALVKGVPMILNCLKNLPNYDTFVVVGAHREKIVPVIHGDFTIIENKSWQEGIASSIRCAVDVLSKKYSRLLITLADQVALTTREYDRLIEASDKNTMKLVCATYKNINGVPAIFPDSYYPKLSDLKGDEGAKRILNDLQNDIESVNLDSGALDIDTSDQLSCWNKKQ